MSTSSFTRLGTLFTAPGNTAHVPTVATVSGVAEWDAASAASACRSIERITSAAAQSASRRSGISSAPAWPPKTFDHDAISCGSRDSSDDSDGQAFSLKQWSLLDMQLQPRMIVAALQSDAGEIAVKSSRLPDAGQRAGRLLFKPVRQLVRALWCKRARDQPTAQASNAEPRRLFGRQHHYFDRAPETSSHCA